MQQNLQFRGRRLSSRRTQIGDVQGAGNTGNRHQFLINRRIQNRLRISRPITHDPRLTRRVEDETHDQRCVWVVFRRPAISAKALKTASRFEIFWTKLPPRICPWGKGVRSTRVTMPKLFAPPLRARKRSGHEVALAFARFPDGRMIYSIRCRTLEIGLDARHTSKLTTLSHAQPTRGAK
jgi:hypothetical protein